MAATTAVAAALYSAQLALLDGAAASNEPLLHAAAALLARPDYDDIVTERSIADACGHLLCANPLLPEAGGSQAGAAPRLRISLREHRVYDLEEARKFCSERCLVASAAFAASLQPERPFGVHPDRLRALVELFDARGGGAELGFRTSGAEEGDVRKVEIREKEAPGPGEVTLQEWIGPSDAIEGYVPRRDRLATAAEGPEPEVVVNEVAGTEQFRNKNVDSWNAASVEDDMTSSSSSVGTKGDTEVIAKKLDDMVLSEDTETPKREATETSDMFSQVEDSDMLSSCISDSIAKQLEDVVLDEKKGRKKKKATKASPRACKSKLAKKSTGNDGHEVDFMSTIIIGDDALSMMHGQTVDQYNFSSSILADEQPSSSLHASRDSMQSCNEQLPEEFSKAANIGKDETSDQMDRPALKSSLRAAGTKNRRRSVTWADEKGSALEDIEAYESYSLRCASAEACAAALIAAAEAVSSGTSVVEDAVSQAGIIILSDKEWSDRDNGKDAVEKDTSEIDSSAVKWPKKTVLLDTDMFEVDDSWHDTPPEGFNLTLSAFASMWAALFGWISRSSLAYLYGLDESSVEELLIVNGREYPRKTVLNDGQSSEIRRALDTFVCNALPVLISNLRIQIPVSKLEITLGYLMDTMSFVDALPSLKSRQWQVMVLVLLDVLSAHALPTLGPVISDPKLLQKVLNSAQVSREEYSSMVDLLLPFGRSIEAPSTS